MSAPSLTGRLLLAASVAVALLVSAPAEARSKRTIDIDGPRLRLSDLLGAVSRDADLGPAPQPGMLRRVPRGRLSGYLSKRRLARLPRFFTVRTRSQSLDCRALRKYLTAALKGRLAVGLRLQAVDCRSALTVPRGPLTLRVRLDKRHRAGRVYATVELRAGLWPWKRLIVPMTVDGMVDVVVLRRPVMAKQRLSRTDLATEKRRASLLRGATFGSVAEALRWEPRGSLRAGTVLLKAHLQPIPLVRRGARVTVEVRLPGLRLTSAGQVRQSAGKGQTVAVLCLKTRKLLRARVVGATRVVVDL